MLFVFSMNVAIGNVNSVAFAPVADIVGEYLHTESSAINWFNTLSIAIILPPIGTIAAHFIDKYGLRFALCATAIVQSLGALIRCGSILIDLFQIQNIDVLKYWFISVH